MANDHKLGVQVAEMYSHIVLEVRGPESSCLQGHDPTEGLEKGLACISSFWCPRLMAEPCDSHLALPVSTSVLTELFLCLCVPFLSLIKAFPLDLRPTLI